jgi:serine/threonine protein kinase
MLNNRYLIGKVIGVGGFGIVYIAWDNNLDIKVAVKEYLPKEYASRSNDHISILPYTGGAKDEYSIGAEKFLDEAKALAKFQDHPGIVTVHESFRTNNTAYMVMQYLDGLTLKEYLKRQPGEKMPFNMAVKAMIPIMDALKEVHKYGFVHRDISPDNIFITKQKQIKLLDFGAARYAIGEHSKSLTSVLKHGYAPVEQYSSKGNQGPWSDVYAVAATIYRAVTGEVPLDAMERIQEDLIKSPKQLGVEIPIAGELALMKGLALKAVDRYTSVPEFQSALLENAVSNTQKTPIDVIEPQRAETFRKAPVNLETQTNSPVYRDYGAETKNHRLTGIKITGVVFIVILAIGSLSSKKKIEAPTRAPAPAVEAPSPIVNPHPEPMPVPEPQSQSQPAYNIPPPQPSYSPPAANSEPDIGRFKYLAISSEGKKFYYDAESYRMATNGNVSAVTIVVNRYGNFETAHRVNVECSSGIMSIDNGRYSSIEQGTIGGALYEKFCNR